MTWWTAIAAAGLLATASAASAHTLLVLTPGGAAIDLGTAQQPRLVHATLVMPGDTLEARLSTDPAVTQQLTLLVPVAAPEGDATRHDLPRAVRRVGGRTERFQEIDEQQRWVDDATGVAYRAIGRLTLERMKDAAQPRVESTISITRGSVPTRAVLLVVEGTEDRFTADDPAATPRALLALRAWAEAPAPGASRARSDSDPAGSGIGRLVWIPICVGVISLLLVVWWLAVGWRRSRERGAERSD